MAQAPPIPSFSIIRGAGGRHNLKYYSPRSESDRGGLVLKIQFCYGQTKNGHHQPSPQLAPGSKKHTSQHCQPDNGTALTLVNAPTNSPSPGPRTPQQRGASARRQLCRASLDSNCSQPALRPIDHLLLRSGFQTRAPPWPTRPIALRMQYQKCVVATFVLSEDTCCFEYAEKSCAIHCSSYFRESRWNLIL